MGEQQSPAEETGALPTASDEESSVSNMLIRAEIEELLESDEEPS